MVGLIGVCEDRDKGKISIWETTPQFLATTPACRYSIVTMVVALVFFVWAVVNTAGGEGFDIGMACFPFAFIGGLTGVYASLRTRRMYTGAHIAALAFGVMVVVFAYAWSSAWLMGGGGGGLGACAAVVGFGLVL